jgi:hypothetical protein
MNLCPPSAPSAQSDRHEFSSAHSCLQPTVAEIGNAHVLTWAGDSSKIGNCTWHMQPSIGLSQFQGSCALAWKRARNAKASLPEVWQTQSYRRHVRPFPIFRTSEQSSLSIKQVVRAD